MRVDGTGARLVHRSAPYDVEPDPLGPDPGILVVWSRDGKRLAVVEVFGPKPKENALFVYNVDGSGGRTLWPLRPR